MTTLIARDPSADIHEWYEGEGFSGPNDLILKPIFLMCAPDSYDPRSEVHEEVNGYVENGMVHGSDSVEFVPQKAQEQFVMLRDKLQSLGASIVLRPSTAGLLDEVFKADPSLNLVKPQFDDQNNLQKMCFRVLSSNFCHHARQPEVSNQQSDFVFVKNLAHERYGVAADLHMIFQDECFGEGTGDNIYDPARNVFWCGYNHKHGEPDPTRGRSDLEFHEVIEQRMNFADRCHPLHVADGFFHLDTTFGVLPRGEVICYPGGMTENSLALMRQKAFADYGLNEKDYLIEIDRADADKFACNFVAVNDTDIVTSAISDELKEKIEGKGYKVHRVDLSQFHMAGGGAHCMVNRINQVVAESILTVQP
ncbi:MAG: hypothetical protein KDI46_03715 [Alphaproteobacteria bacterium]|nr:hypothetical protein [Alphaproteobacteria bacterium]